MYNTHKLNPISQQAKKIAEEAKTKDKQEAKIKTETIRINGFDTNINNNVPCVILGDKGSGKTTFLKSFIELTNKTTFSNIFFIYSDINGDEDLPPYVIRININSSLEFLSNYLEVRNIFNSYVKFFKGINFKELHKEAEEGTIKAETFLKNLDNNISKYNKTIINSDEPPKIKIDKIINTGERLLKTFSKPFTIADISLPGLKYGTLDALFIDDIAIASKILFETRTNNNIYTYMTLTRHLNFFFCLSGQQVDQVPKFMRREVMTWIMSRNTSTELLKGIIPQQTLKEITQQQANLKPYQFLVYNTISTNITTI